MHVGNGQLTNHHVYDHNLFFNPAIALLGNVQINRLVRKNLKIMLALFIIAIAVFIYMIYVLIKPEKF
ncbi:potassium-transporting ATPase subunit F [Pedobacter sp.]